MSEKKETALQQRIQKYIEQRGGYVNKNHGSMITEPGLTDLTVSYNGIYIGIEVKVGDNTPSRHQGIQCRAIRHSKGLTLIAWDIDTVKDLLDLIDAESNTINNCLISISNAADKNGADDGTKW